MISQIEVDKHAARNKKRGRVDFIVLWIWLLIALIFYISFWFLTCNARMLIFIWQCPVTL